jgi:hypothetical protein
MGYVTNQTYNMTSRQFTTNFFRCYDLPLAVGVNTIVLQAVDGNNNTNSLSVNYTVDFSVDTNAPVFTLQWPTNGMAVSGNTFTMNGTVDNPSASVRVSVASTNETNDFYGIVSGSGRNAFWVPDVTLPAGTSTVTMVVTSPGGMSSTSSVSIAKNTSAELTIQPSSSAINEFNQDLPASVSGYIRGSGYSVSLNGRSGTTDYDSGTDITYWSVTNVPGNEDGWMELVATAVSSGGGAPITAKYEFEKPPLLRLKEYHLDTTITAAGFPETVAPHREVLHYKRKEGGYYFGTLWNDSGCTSTWDWTADDVFGNYSKYCNDVLQNGTYYSAPPTYTGELTEEYQAVEDGDHFYTYSRSLNQEREMRAGGKPYPGRKDLADFPVSATEHDYLFNNDINLPFFATNLGPVAASAIKLFGKSPDGNGKVPELVVPSSIIPIPPLVAVQNKGINIGAPQSQGELRILRGSDITWKTPQVIAGEGITLMAGWTGTPGISNYQWTVGGFPVSDYTPTASFAKAYALTSKTNDTVTFHLLPDQNPVPVRLSVTLSNGIKQNASTTFNVGTPTASFSSEFLGEVGWDDNLLGLFIVFGKTSTEPGIRFRGEGMAPNSTASKGRWFFCQTVDTEIGKNHVAGYSISYATNALDSADNDFAYETFETNTIPTFAIMTQDSPRSLLEDEFLKVRRTDWFTMYLMFQYTNGPAVPVPIREIPWFWSVTCTNEGGDWHVQDYGYGSSASAKSTALPEWNHNVSNIHWVTNANWIP